MNKLFVLSGSSACGKTTLMNNALKENSSLSVVQKYGTRRRRPAKDGIEDDVCQVFNSAFPETISVKELICEADEFISSIWKKTSNCSYHLKKNPPLEKKVIFTKLVSQPDFFEKETQITSEGLIKILSGILSQYYKLQDGLLKIKLKLSNDKRQLLSHLLEDLDIRRPLITLGEGQYWDDYGEKVSLKGNIDIAYALNKGQYGISTENIWHELKHSRNVITILSDFRIINRLKNIFNDSIVVVYVASAVDTAKLEKIQIGRHGIDNALENSLKKKIERLNSSVNISKWGNVAKWIHELNEDWEKTKPDADSTKFRAERIKTFHTRYIDNITIFDYVILNYHEGHPEDMTAQFNNIMKVNNKKTLSNKSPLFVVAAASNAGKGTMMEMLNLIGSDQVQILSKIAKRKEKGNDKKDGMLPIGTPEEPPKNWPQWPDWWNDDMINTAKQGKFPNEYDFSWLFHGNVLYAVSDNEIKYNFDKNKPQIVISNTDQIEKFINRYGERVVFILLYRLSSIEDTKSYYEIEEGLTPKQAETRADEVNEVLQEYIKKINYFSHVILNTTRPEDLYDQIFQLIEFYHPEKK